MGVSAFLSVVLILFTIGCSAVSESPLATTEKGTLKGKYEISRNGNRYETFLGIRYAEVQRRFDVSQPTGKWDGVKDSTEFGSHCAQQSLVGSPATGEEDCLFLNVFTPKTDNKKRAVLVYVHGGGFNMGASTEFGGSFLVDEEIVLVTINYRLGILGFLNTLDGGGNMGLKDQVLALKWIQENIEHFGGDKDRVTICGNSAGGASALYLMTSPLAQGLYHRVYVSSGTPISPFSFVEKSIQEATEMGDHLNCNINSTVDLVACLRDEPLETLMLAQKTIQKWNLDLFRIRPSLEVKSTRNPEPFLDELPEDRFREGNFAKVPIILTMTPHEGAMTYAAMIVRNEELLKSLNDEFERVAPITFGYEIPRKLKLPKDQVTKEILKFYFDGDPITPAREMNLTNLYTDAWYAHSIKTTAHILGAQTSVYVGIFSHDRTDFSPVRLFGIQDDMEGVTNCEDLSFIFNPTGFTGPVPHLAQLSQEKDIQFSKKFVKLIASFVQTGIPKVSFGELPEWSPVTKGEIESNSLNWLNLADDVFLLKNPLQERMQFWDNFYMSDTDTHKKDEL